VIKYIGSKRLLIPRLLQKIDEIGGLTSAADLFSGTSRVGHALKKQGIYCIANDHNLYAHTLARCYVEADAGRVREDAVALLEELINAPEVDGWFTENYCRQSRFFKPENGRKIEGIRTKIKTMELEPSLEAIALVSLMEAADRVDSTTGVQMAYLKSWAPRAHKPLELRLPSILPGSGKAINLDVLDAAREVEADLVYLDPPYNQHSYLGNYHVWETLVRWDAPEIYGVACKRIDCRDPARKSDFNSKRKIEATMRELIATVRAKHLILSFSNEGFLDRELLETMLGARGVVTCDVVDYKRYVGAQIGVYNPSGKKIGSPTHLRNVEYLFHVTIER